MFQQRLILYTLSVLFLCAPASGADPALNLQIEKTRTLKKLDKSEVLSVCILANGSIAISDWDLTKSPPDSRLELYGTDGKLIRAVGAMGSGPGKYASLGQLTVDEKDVIWAADTGQRRLSRYGADGALIGSDLIMSPSFSPSFILLKPEMGKKYLAGCVAKDNNAQKGCSGLVHEYDLIGGKYIRSFLSTENDRQWIDRSYRRMQQTFMDAETAKTIYASSFVARGFWMVDIPSGNSKFVPIPMLPELPDMGEVADARKAWETLQTPSHIFQINGYVYLGVRTPGAQGPATQIMKFDSTGKFLAKTLKTPGILAGKTKEGRLIFTQRSPQGVSVIITKPTVPGMRTK